jgi:hypothetical protein
MINSLAVLRALLGMLSFMFFGKAAYWAFHRLVGSELPSQQSDRLGTWVTCGCLPVAFVSLLSFFGFFHSLENLTHVTSGMMAVGFVFAGYRGFQVLGKSIKPGSSISRRAFFEFAAVFLILTSINFYLGYFPLVVSDTWGHLTMINRMLVEGVTKPAVLFFPGDPVFLSFSPWHALMAALAASCQASPLEIWIAGSILLPPLLVFSYLSFLETVFPEFSGSFWKNAVSCVLFLLLYPSVHQFVRGVADYKIINHVILFQALRVGYLWLEEKVPGKSHFGYLLLAVFTMACIHLIEPLLFLLMLFPYAAIRSFQSSNGRYLKKILLLSAATIVCCEAILKVYFNHRMPLEFSEGYRDFLSTCLLQWKILFGYPGFLSLIFFVPVIRFGSLKKDQIAWVLGCTAGATLLGSVDPLLFGLYSRVASSTLGYRTMYVFPHYLILSLFAVKCAEWIKGKTPPLSRNLALVSLTFLVFATGSYLFTSWGIDGSPSYMWSDRFSQMRLYPNLYEEIKKLKNKVILSDTFTSMPVTVLSSNFIVANRPWNDTDPRRHEIAQRLTRTVAGLSLDPEFCRLGVDIVVMNWDPPEVWKESFRQSPWLFASFYDGHQIPNPAYFTKLGEWDGNAVYEFQKIAHCAKTSI